MILVFDTETTGLVQHKLPAEHPSQPRLVQLAGILADDEGRVLRARSAIIKPIGFSIPREASEVHGITDDLAMDAGEGLGDVLSWHAGVWALADLIICHNTDFDIKVIEADRHRSALEPLIPRVIYCTMKETTNLLKLPGKYGYKWPKLEELYGFLFGEKLVGAHDALEDTRATLRC